MVMSKKNDGITALKEEKKPKWKPTKEQQKTRDVFLTAFGCGDITEEGIIFSHDDAKDVADVLAGLSKLRRDMMQEGWAATNKLESLLQEAEDNLPDLPLPKKPKKAS
jgi:hypothetical protein